MRVFASALGIAWHSLSNYAPLSMLHIRTRTSHMLIPLDNGANRQYSKDAIKMKNSNTTGQPTTKQELRRPRKKQSLYDEIYMNLWTMLQKYMKF
jgi:hypothetical protein